MSNPQLNSQDDSDSVNDDRDRAPDVEIPGEDSYEENQAAHVLFRGVARSYNQCFVVTFYVVPEDNHFTLENVTALAGEDTTLLHRIDLDQSPSEIKLGLIEAVNNLGDSKLRDSQDFQRKLQRSLKQSDMLEELCEPLRSGEADEFKENLRNFLRDELFPGSLVELSIKVVSPHQEIEEMSEDTSLSDSSGEENTPEGTEQNQDARDTKVLKTNPEYDPIDGVKLEQLSPGDSLFVRIVGPSVKNLNEAFIDGDNPEQAKQSKLLTANMEEITDSPRDGMKTFTVSLDSNVVGKFTVDPSSKVKVDDVNQISWFLRFQRQIYISLAILLIFLFSASVSFFFFPEAVLNLMD